MRIFTFHLLLLLAAFIFSFRDAAAQCLSGTYTIGGVSPSYSTVNAAVSDLAANGVCGPVTFLVRDGIYNEQVVIPAITGASGTNTITFQGENGSSADVSIRYPASSSSSFNYVIQLNGADHIVFRYIDMERTGQNTYGDVVLINNNAEHNLFEYCELKAQQLYNSTSTMRLVFSPNTADNFNTFQNNSFINGSDGVFMLGTTGTPETGITISGNSFTGQYKNFVWISYAADITLNDNDMMAGVTSAHHTAAGFNYCSGLLSVQRNKLIKTYGTGIYLANSTFGSSSPAVIANNFITTSWNSSTAYGISCSNVSNAVICFNSISLNSSFQTTGFDIYSSSNIDFRNNMISGGSLGIKVTAPVTGFISDHNNIKPVSLTVGSSNYTSLQTWNAATGYDSSSISFDPLFVSGFDLHITNNIDVDGKGIPVTGILTDIDGQLRDPSSPDIGADEFTPQPDNAKLLSTDLRFPVCPGSMPVNVKIRNMGANTITGLNIKWMVNNIMQPPVAWTGSISSGDSTAFTLAGTYSFVRDQVYAIKIWTDSVNGNPDPQPSNDTIRFVNGLTKMDTIYTIGGMSPDYTSFTAAVSDLTNRGVCGPVTFNVRNGIYNEQISVGPISGASAVNRITFQSENLDSTLVKLVYPITYQGNNYVVRLYGAKYITFRKMTMLRQGQQVAGYYEGVIVDLSSNARHNVFENNIMQTSQLLPTSNLYTMSVVYSSVFNNTMRNDSNLFARNVINNGTYGFYFSRNVSAAPEHGLTIKDNVMNNQTDAGIYISNNKQLEISGNSISSNRDTVSPGNYFGILLTNGSGDFTISRNKISHVTGTGIGIANSVNPAAAPSLIANNFIANRARAIEITGSQNIHINHNSVNGRGTSALLGFSTTAGIDLKNNIFAAVNGANIFTSNSVGFTSNYNNLFTAGSINTTYPTLVSWQTTGNDLNSVSIAPGYFSLTDLHIVSNSALDGLAQPSGLIRDIDNALRSTTVPDMGADEFSAPAYDLGVVSLVQPTAQACHGSPYVKISVKNHNTASADTIRSFFVYWELNGNMVDTFLWQGILPPGDTLRDLIISKYYFQYGTTYQFRIWTALPNYSADINNVNDTLVEIPFTSMGGVYTIGGYRPDFTSFMEAQWALGALGVCDSVVFNVRNGQYLEQITFNRIKGSSSVNTVTFQSEQGDSSLCQLVYPINNTVVDYVLRLDSTDHMRFKRLTIGDLTPLSSYWPNGPTIQLKGGTSDIVFANNILMGHNGNVTPTKTQIVVVRVSGAGSNNTRFYNNHVKYGTYGIEYTAPCSNTVIEGNVFTNGFSNIIRATWQDSLYIRKNKLHSTSTYYETIYLEECNDEIEITGNHLNPEYYCYCYPSNKGVYLKNCNGTTSNPILIANNFIAFTETMHSHASQMAGIFLDSSSYVNVYHNSILMDIGEGYPTNSSALRIQRGININIKNNILSNFRLGFGLYTQYLYSIASSDHNNIYALSGSDVFDVTGQANQAYNGATLAQWQTFTGHDLNSVSVDPGFKFHDPFSPQTDLADLHLDINMITPVVSSLYIPQLPLDIDGDTRAATPTIGADEYVPLLNNSAVLHLDQPTLNPCSGNQPVNVTIANFGSQPLTSLTLQWTVDNIAQPAFAWTGSINPGDTLPITIGSYNFPSQDSVDVVVWVEMPNGVPETYTFRDTTMANIRTSMAGTYTIGGTNPDYATFNAAVSALLFRGVCAPVVFNVRSGSYTEQLQIYPVPGASYTNTITFQSEMLDSNAVVLQYNTANLSNLGNHVVYLDGADHIRFHRLTLRNLNTQTNSYRRVLWLNNGADNIRVTNCVVESQYVAGSGLGFADAVISADPDYLEGPLNNDLHIMNNLIRNGTCGIVLSGYDNPTATYSSGLKVMNNKIIDATDYGINILSTRAPVIEDNYVGVTSLVNGYGLYGMMLTGMLDSFQVVSNVVDSFRVGGIVIGNSLGLASTPGLIANNSVYIHDPWNSTNALGIALSSSSHVKVYHNSIHLAGNSPTSAALHISQNTTGIDIRNNMVMNSALGYAVYSNANNAASIQADYNNLFTMSSVFAFNNGNVASFAAWQSSTGFDANSISMDPVYASYRDLHFLNFLADDQGTPVAGPAFDLDGNLRSATAPDIGCYEVTLGSAATDAAAAAVTAPASQFCAAQMPVAATIQNAGSNIMYGADVNWSVNNIIQPVYQWSGVLQPSAYSPVLALGNYYFTAGTHIVKVWTSSPNGFVDPNPVNDTVAFTVTALQHPVSNLGPDTAFCSGGQVVLNPGTFSSYQWSTGTTSSTLTVTNTGTYSVMVTDAFGCMDSDTISVVVNPLPPMPTITFNAGVLTSSAATGNQWLFNNNPIPGATGQTHVPTQSGNYKVIVTNSFGCTSQSTAYIYYVGIEENEIAYFSVYPIPATETVSIELGSKVLSNVTIGLIDVLGNTVKEISMESAQGTLQDVLDISPYANGVYLVKISSRELTAVQRFIKQ